MSRRAARSISVGLKQHVTQIYRFAIPHGWAERDPVEHLAQLLKPKPRMRHMARVGLDEPPALVRAIDSYDAVGERLREIANERRRFGYRRLAILLRREGKGMNLKKVYGLYREERLAVRKRGGRKRALGTRAPMAIPQESNQRWPLDFVSDALACGPRFRMLNVIDDYSRRCLACIVDTSPFGPACHPGA